MLISMFLFIYFLASDSCVMGGGGWVGQGEMEAERILERKRRTLTLPVFFFIFFANGMRFQIDSLSQPS